MRYCSNCGELNDTDAKFCANCGKAFDGTLQETEIVVPDPSIEEVELTSKEVPVYEQKAEGRPVRGRVFGIIGFVLSLEAIICCLIPFTNLIALIEAIIALIFCKLSKKNTSFKLANAGHTLGVIALVFSILTIIIFTVLLVVGILAISTDPNVQEFLDQLFTNGITITFN